MPRALLVFAHPDHEVIAIGGRMDRFAKSHFVHVTDSAPRNGQDSGLTSARFCELAREAEHEVRALKRELKTKEVRACP